MNHNQEAFEFENHARHFLSQHWHITLRKKQVAITPTFEKEFDLVSDDSTYVGDAKYYMFLDDPGAQWSAIAEYVWLLEKVNAQKKFMVFGKQKETARQWLDKHRSLVQNIKFYFLSDNDLEELQ